ncbi:branched-chain amino acid ABC transporter permease LivH [Pseudomonas aeruginosa]
MDGIFLQQMINGLTLGSVYGLIAIGYTMVYGIIGMINFAHGEVYMISAYLSAIALALLAIIGLQNFPLLILGTLLFTVLVTSTYGWVIERIAYQPLRNGTRLAPLISAIGMSLILQNAVQVAQGPRQQGIPTLLDGARKFHVRRKRYERRPAHLHQAVHPDRFADRHLLVVLDLTLIRYTKLGRMCRATQQDRKMASILGINTDRVISYVFVIGAAMAALAAVLISMNYGTFDFNPGFIIGIKAFTAAVLGGIGTLPGAMLGGLVLGVAEAQFSRMVNTDYKDVVAFSLLVLILIFRPQGLLGRPQIAKV